MKILWCATNRGSLLLATLRYIYLFDLGFRFSLTYVYAEKEAHEKIHFNLRNILHRRRFRTFQADITSLSKYNACILQILELVWSPLHRTPFQNKNGQPCCGANGPRSAAIILGFLNSFILFILFLGPHHICITTIIIN